MELHILSVISSHTQENDIRSITVNFGACDLRPLIVLTRLARDRVSEGALRKLLALRVTPS